MSEHGKLIDDLGGADAVAEAVSAAAKEPVDRWAVYKWKTNGVPYRWRPFVARLAIERSVKLPKDLKAYAA